MLLRAMFSDTRAFHFFLLTNKISKNIQQCTIKENNYESMLKIVVPLIPVVIQFLKQFNALLFTKKSKILLKHKKGAKK